MLIFSNVLTFPIPTRIHTEIHPRPYIHFHLHTQTYTYTHIASYTLNRLIIKLTFTMMIIFKLTLSYTIIITYSLTRTTLILTVIPTPTHIYAHTQTKYTILWFLKPRGVDIDIYTETRCPTPLCNAWKCIAYRAPYKLGKEWLICDKLAYIYRNFFNFFVFLSLE